MALHLHDRNFVQELTAVIQSSRLSESARACLLGTLDREHAISKVKDTAAACDCKLYHFSLSERLCYDPERRRWDVAGGESPDVSALLRQAAKVNGGVVIVEGCLPLLCDDRGDARAYMTLAQMLSSEGRSDRCQGLTLVFLEPPSSERFLPPMLADLFVQLTVGYPETEELEAIARVEIARAVQRAPDPVDVKSIKRAARKLAPCAVGLTWSAARDALRDALAPDPQDFHGAFQRLQRSKEKRLRRQLAMNVLDTSSAEIPIGLDHLFDYLHINRGRMRAFGPGRAKGVLLIGPPGTGKTMLALSIGKIVDLPVVEFRISALMNSLLGETEGLFEKAFSTLQIMSPNVVFIDEMDKVFGDPSERDGGTIMRCTGSLLSWLSDNPYPNYIVATCNSLRRMGEMGLTITRSGRFDSSFFVDVPNCESRRRMLERWLGDHADMAAQTAEMTDKFSGADLYSVVKLAVARAEHEKVKLSLDVLKREVERKRLRAIALYDEFEELRRFGRLYCEPAGPTGGSEP